VEESIHDKSQFDLINRFDSRMMKAWLFATVFIFMKDNNMVFDDIRFCFRVAPG